MRRSVLPLLLAITGTLLAESAVQTDWSGGPGVPGPVTLWGDRFNISDEMDWDTEPGQLKLIVDRSERIVAPYVSTPPFVLVMDIDHDRSDDIAYSSYGTGQIFWARNLNGEGTSWSHQLVGTVDYPQFIAAGDFDGDGVMDLAASSSSQEKVLWFRNNPGGSAWSAPHTVAQNFDAQQIRVADIDGDGDPDIVGVSWLSGDVVWWRSSNNGNTWTMRYIDGSLMGAYACETGDVNGDGHPDVVAVSYSTGRVMAYISHDPWGFSWTQQEAGIFPGARAVAISDIDRDGQPDILAGSAYGGGSLRWYRNQGGSVWTMNTIDGAVPGLSAIAVQDLDGDGCPDVVTSSTSGNSVFWFKNNLELGLPWERYTIAEGFGGAYCVATGDLSGDGVPDVAACALYSGKVSWWKVSGFETPATLTSSILDVEPIDPGALTWDYLHWSQVIPPDTGILFRLRTSYTADQMGPWSSWLCSPASLGQVVAQGGRYVQYQTRLYTQNPNVTPSLKDVTVLYDMYGIADDPWAPAEGRRITILQGNPVTGPFTVLYNVMAQGPVTVSLFDTSGRTVTVLQRGELTPGTYSALVGSLPAGVYAVVLSGPDGMTAQRVTVLN